MNCSGVSQPIAQSKSPKPGLIQMGAGYRPTIFVHLTLLLGCCHEIVYYHYYYYYYYDDYYYYCYYYYYYYDDDDDDYD